MYFRLNKLKTKFLLGVLNEGDYLLQVGSYSLIGIDITVALILIERAYDEERNVKYNFIFLFSIYCFQTISFVAARRLKSSVDKELPKSILKKPDDFNRKRTQSQVSFIDYEDREEDDDDVDESNDTKL